MSTAAEKVFEAESVAAEDVEEIKGAEEKLQFETVEQVQRLHGKVEDDVFEVKRELLSLQAITKKIHSFMNGHQETGFIFLGISEDHTHRIDVNRGFQLNFSPENAFFISDSENAKPKQKNIKIETIDDYKMRVISYLKSNTVGCTAPHIDEIVKFRKLEKEDNSFVIIIEVNQSVYRPLQFKQDCKFYMRYSESGSGKGDAESRPMFSQQVAEENHRRYVRMITFEPQEPIYHSDAIPAIPELAKVFDSIYNGNHEAVFVSLRDFPTITQMTDSFGNTILNVALIYEKNLLAKRLVEEYDMSIYQSNKEGWTPLFSAIYVGNLEAVKFLLSEDENLIRHRDRLGNNAILLAALYGHKNIIEWFRSGKANFLNQNELQLNIRNDEGWNTLFVAVYANELDMVKFLFQEDPTLLAGIDRHGHNVIELARDYDCSEELIGFLEEASVLENAPKVQVSGRADDNVTRMFLPSGGVSGAHAGSLPDTGLLERRSTSDVDDSADDAEDATNKKSSSRSPSPTGSRVSEES